METYKLLGKLLELREQEGEPGSPDAEPEQEPTPSPDEEQGTIAAFLEGTIHQTFTVTADKLFQMGLMNRGERISLSSAIGDALGRFREAVEEKAPETTKRSMDPDIARQMTLKENRGGKEKAQQ